jgi:hypothetical protein
MLAAPIGGFRGKAALTAYAARAAIGPQGALKDDMAKAVVDAGADPSL